MPTMQVTMKKQMESNVFNNGEEESVDQLLEKLAKKGKKVKIINENDQHQTPALEEDASSPNF